MNFINKDCPYCKKSTETKETDFFYQKESYMEILKYEYLKKVNSQNFEEFIKNNLKLVKCNECKLIFFKNWFDSETSKKIYNSKPHRVGWGSFYLFYNQNNKLKEYIKKKIAIFNLINNKILNIKSYAELNCPFSGLMLLFNFADKEKNFKLNILNNLAKEKSYFPNIIFKILNKFKIFFFNCLILKEKTLNIFLKEKNFKNFFYEEKKFNLPTNINLIKVDNSSLSWNYGCNNMGQNCRKIFSYFKGFKLVNFEEIEEENNKSNFKFDLFYLENTIDHISDLSTTLNRIKKISKNIVIITHGKKAGPQHLFYLNEDFFLNYCKLNNLKLHILTKDITNKDNNDLDNQYYLLTSTT